MLSHDKRIRSKEQLNDWLKYECQKYGNPGLLRNIYPVTESDVLWKHQRLLRKTEYYVNSGNKVLSVIYKVRLMRMQNKFALHIPINTCDIGLRIMHVGPILLNRNVTVGKDCAFHINTSLVADGVSNEVPTLGDEVVVGIGAVIVGGVHVANSVAIGANAVVTKDINEADIAVAGVPAKKISQNGRSSWNKKDRKNNPDTVQKIYC